MSNIYISDQELSLKDLNQQVQVASGEVGACVIFTGVVRVSNAEQGLTGMSLEHYPGMTEQQLEKIIQQASHRWQLGKVIVAHRVGYLEPGDPIVFVGVTALHRRQAFDAAEFIMDYLKMQATFWKKEHYGDKQVWVEAKKSDEIAAERWS